MKFEKLLCVLEWLLLTAMAIGIGLMIGDTFVKAILQ